ncbi:Cofilin [Dactylella cylindrospora]|nr:Cofilin [Dactylella cylindrospora]
MSRSGVGLHNDCISRFEELKLKKSLKYIIYGLNATKTEVVIISDSSSDEVPSDSQGAYEKFLTHFPGNECRWGVYDFEFEKEPGEGKRNKICFFSWSPDDAPIRSKMVFASSKDAIRRALAGIGVEIQGTDFSEVAYETVLEKCQRGR